MTYHRIQIVIDRSDSLGYTDTYAYPFTERARTFGIATRVTTRKGNFWRRPRVIVEFSGTEDAIRLLRDDFAKNNGPGWGVP